MTPFLSLQNVTKSFSGVKALNGVNLEIDAGEVCCLLGENGSGKSSLIKTLSGVHAPDSGEILVNGRSAKRWRPIDAISAGIEVIYQDFSLFPNLSVMENICLLRQTARGQKLVDWRATRKAAMGALKKINVDIDLHARVEDLSVAQRQLVAIARALLGNPSLIVMDEPTSALTAREIERLLQIIEQLRQQKVSVIFVSHKLDEVLRLAEHVVVLRNGVKVFDDRSACFERAQLVNHMVGRDLPQGRGVRRGLQGETLLLVTGLGRARYYEDVSFELRAGEVLGLTGQLDSGRTALVLSLYGMLPPERGSIKVEGVPVALTDIPKALDNAIAMVPEDRLTEGLFLRLSVGANLSAGILPKLTNALGILDPEKIDAYEEGWIKRLSIKTASVDAPVSSLSGGNQQRVVLAKALARNPRVIILNGPTVGVDVGSKDEIHQIIEALSAEGLGVILVSDDTEELERLCDRVLIMRRGRIADEIASIELTPDRLEDMSAERAPC